MGVERVPNSVGVGLKIHCRGDGTGAEELPGEDWRIKSVAPLQICPHPGIINNKQHFIPVPSPIVYTGRGLLTRPSLCLRCWCCSSSWRPIYSPGNCHLYKLHRIFKRQRNLLLLLLLLISQFGNIEITKLKQILADEEEEKDDSGITVNYPVYGVCDCFHCHGQCCSCYSSSTPLHSTFARSFFSILSVLVYPVHSGWSERRSSSSISGSQRIIIISSGGCGAGKVNINTVATTANERDSVYIGRQEKSLSLSSLGPRSAFAVRS